MREGKKETETVGKISYLVLT